MSSPEYSKVSKFLSYILRHNPDDIGLELDEKGWANINDLIHKACKSGKLTTLDPILIQTIVEKSDKKRFAISEDGLYIRANQGHSLKVDLQLEPIEPPELLYHGTATRFLDTILKEGLKSQQRQYVHLSNDIETADTVGKRYGKPVILTIKSLDMYEHGYKFYQAKNGVWLAGSVPHEYIFIHQ